MRRGGRNEEDGGIPCRASLPALSVLFACSQVTSCPVARTFGVFRWQPGRDEPRCPHFRPFLLASGTHRASLPAFLPIFAGKQDFGAAD